MTISPTASAFQPPSDPADFDGWLAAREAELAAMTRAALRKMIDETTAEFVGSLTAAGDVSVFDAIVEQWRVYVASQAGPYLAGMYLAGATQAGSTVLTRGVLDAAELARWSDVVNSAAVLFQESASNRLVGVGDNLWRAVRARATEGITQGLSNEQVKDQIEALTGFTEQRADTIARTEAVGAYNGGEYDSAVALGTSGPDRKVWLAALDDRTRDSHVIADGQEVPMNGVFMVGGYACERPHDPSLPPEEVINCRCVVEFLWPEDDRESIDAQVEAAQAEQAADLERQRAEAGE